jgi:DNA-binding transcriptional MerR regulator
MRISELSAASGVPAKTIRYYEQIGILGPVPRTANGYRIFTEEVVDRLAFVRAAQAVGLTLSEIGGIFAVRDRGESPCGHVLDLITCRKADLDVRIERLEHLRTDLQHLASRAEALDPADCEPRGICHLIDTPTDAGALR